MCVRALRHCAISVFHYMTRRDMIVSMKWVTAMKKQAFFFFFLCSLSLFHSVSLFFIDIINKQIDR